MKKLTIGLAVLFAGVTANSFAYATGSRYGVCVPNFCGGFNFGVTGYYWEPSTPHEDFALTYPALDSVDPSLTNFANGRFHDTDQNYNWGWGVNIGYTFACTGNDVNLDWMHFDHDESDSVRVADTFVVVDPTVATLAILSGPLLFPTLTDSWPASAIFIIDGIDFGAVIGGGIGLPVSVNPTFARATSKFKVDAVDLDFGQHLVAGCNTHMRFYGGLRYAKLEHKYNAFYSGTALLPSVVGAGTGLVTFDITIAFTDVLRQKTEFDGIGPRFGIHTNYVFGCSGFGVVGDISSALLIGRLDSNLDDRLLGTFTGLVTAIGTGVTDFAVGEIVVAPVSDTFFTFKHPKETRVVPNMDAKLGLDYTYDFCNCSHSKLTIEAGWMVSYYWNSVDRLSETEADFPAFRTRHTIDTSFQGPYVTVQVQL